MNKRNRPKKAAIIALLTLLAVFFHISGWLNPVYAPLTGLLTRLAAPFHTAGSGLSRVFGHNAGEADADPASLRATIEQLQIENVKLKALASENESLKAALAFKELGQDRAVPAQVIYETVEDESRLLVLDKGLSDGLRPGQPVIAGNGVIAGKILTARQRTSVVLPLTDSRSRLAVAVLNSPETLGLLEGDRGLSMAVTLIPQAVTVSPGDTVITSGLEPGIRRGLVVGTVENVDKPTQDPFQSANVLPFPSATHPLLVQVLTGANEQP